jgi:DNA-binding NarL/FixJ family response regulator
MRRQLDQLALSSLLSQTPGVELVGAETTLTDAVDVCRTFEPAAVIVDATYPDSSAFKVARWLINDGLIERVAFLDDRLTLLRAQQALSITGACYFTRDERIDTVCAHLRGSRHAIGVSSPLLQTPSRPSLITDSSTLSQFDKYGILTLTAKERRIMTLLAQGYQVREIAQVLELSGSTVDNHKSRIMRKLKVHRSTLLARVAVETGLVDQ